MDYYTASCRSYLRNNGFALSNTSGSSMRPLIWGGEHCVAVAPMEEEPEKGDLLLFVSRYGGKERNIVHRLVEIRQEGGKPLYVTRGDNCLGCEYVRRPEIIGRVAEVHRITGFRPWHIIPAKKFAVTDPAYLIYSRVWHAIWPARRIYYLMRGHAAGLGVRLRSVFKHCTTDR